MKDYDNRQFDFFTDGKIFFLKNGRDTKGIQNEDFIEEDVIKYLEEM